MPELIRITTRPTLMLIVLGKATCDACTAGFFCPQNTTDPTANPCPTGHYCPPATSHAYQYACPQGTYNPDTHSTNASACLLCPPGMYCEVEGLQEPTGNCTEGWFCTGGAMQAKPIVIGKSSESCSLQG